MNFINKILNQSADFFLIDEQIGEIEGFVETQQYDDYYLKLIDANTAVSMEIFMETMASNMDFPDYFGHNWSALSDSFREKIWQSKNEQYVLVFTNSDNLLIQKRKDLADLFDTLKDIIGIMTSIKLKIIFLVKDARNSHLGQAISNENFNAKVIYQE